MLPYEAAQLVYESLNSKGFHQAQRGPEYRWMLGTRIARHHDEWN